MKKKKSNDLPAIHQPVLKNEVEKYLAVKTKGLYIDTTVGGGGHTRLILEHGGQVLGLDQDEEALKLAAKHLKKFIFFKCKRLTSACPAGVLNLAHGNFADLKKIAEKFGFVPADGILFDLGISSFQLASENRGFSFLQDEPLDMRLDPKSQQVTAADLVNALPKRRLYEAFDQLVEEKLAWPIAQAIGRTRGLKPIKTTRQLAGLVERVYRRRGWHSRIHPATKVFLALRILVNLELENLKKALPQALEVLRPKGRLLVISFHSTEDRIVKNFFRQQERLGKAEILTKKPIRPSDKEKRQNPRSRSAKLRVLLKK